MLSDEQKAAAAIDECGAKKEAYRAAALALDRSIADKASPDEQARCIRELHRQATAFFDSVESAVSKSELFGASRSEHWATDLANTSYNVLDNVPQLYDRLWRDSDRLGIARPKPSPSAFSSMQSAVAIYNPDQRQELQDRFQQRGLPTRGFTHVPEMNTKYADWEKIFMAATGVIFLLILLAIAIWVKDFNNLNIMIFRTVLALVGGAFAAVAIPGLLEIKTGFVRATGAAAVFGVIFFFNPPALVQNVVNNDATQHASPSPAPSAP
jgi:hypothetical protein